MKLLKFNLSSIFLSIIILSCPFVYAQGENLKAYYPLKQGDIREYQVKLQDEIEIEKMKVDGKENVNNIETTKVVYADGSYDCIEVDFEGIKLYKIFDAEDRVSTIFTPAKLLLPFNIESTTLYKYSFLSYDSRGSLLPDSSGAGFLEIKFEKRDNVEVLAGKFLNCIKIFVSDFSQDRDGSFLDEKSTIWFAEGLGQVKEIREEQNYEVEERILYAVVEESELKKGFINGINYGEEN